MANPQSENGHIDIANEVQDAFCHIRIAGEQRQCLDFIIRKTWGWKKKEDIIAISQFYKATGIPKPHIIRALKALEDRKFIVANNGNRYGKSYRFNKNYEQWKSLPKKVTQKIVAKKGNLPLPILGTTKDTSTKDNIYGELKNVRLSEKQFNKLVAGFGDETTKEYIARLSLYMSSKGKRYKSHYATILVWMRKDGIRRMVPAGKPKQPEETA